MFPPSGYDSRVLSFPVVLCVMIAELLWMASFGRHEGYDTGGYLDAADMLASGRLDYFRPPVYPAFLLLLRAVVGSGGLYVAVNVVQAVMMIVSARYFRLICLRLFHGRARVAFWLTAVYCLLPSVQYQVMLVMTEAPAIAGMVFLLWWLVRDYPGRMSVRAGMMAGLWLVFLVFLRPILLCMVPVVAVWLSVRSVRNGGRGIAAAWCGLGMCVLSVAVYMGLMNRVWGIHSFSGVSVANNYCMVCDAGLLYPHHTDNPALRAQMSRIYDGSYILADNPLYLKTRDVPDWSEELPPSEIEAAVNRAIADHPLEVARHIMYRLRWMVRPAPMSVLTQLPVLRTFEQTFMPTLGLFIIFLAAFPIWLVVRWRRGDRALPLWLLWLAGMAVTWTALVGAMNDWGRLILPCVPAAILLVYAVLSQWHYSPGRFL